MHLHAWRWTSHNVDEQVSLLIDNMPLVVSHHGSARLAKRLHAD